MSEEVKQTYGADQIQVLEGLKQFENARGCILVLSPQQDCTTWSMKL